MAGEPTLPAISRRASGVPPDFERLRDEGIRLLQALAGDLWTDYNLHDPGVTILEQLCYGLTDLLYRTGFPVRDHLTGPDGRIDLEGQALHRPERVFPCRPTTPDDHRRAILDAVPGVENVWIDPWPGPEGRFPEGSGAVGVPRGADPGPTGVHRIRVHLSHHAADPEAVRDQVRACYHAGRNLGEDLLPEVEVVDERHVHLGLRLEITGARAPEEILAHVFEVVRREVAGVGGSRPDGSPPRTLEERLTGPLSARGMGPASPLPEAGRVHVADLVARVRGVPGVAEVRELYLEGWGTDARSSLERVGGDGVLCLRIPDGLPDPARVGLSRGGRPVPLSASLFQEKVRELSDAERHGALDRKAASTLYRIPEGRNRDAAPYRSIQEHFPAVYGVNRFGLPASATEEERARVAQLKAYLVPMEQLLANRMEGIRDLRRLFSTSDPGGPTYRYEVLDDDRVPAVSQLWREEPAPVLDEVLHGFDGLDRRWERRSRLLDHMLAVFGERFDPAPVLRLQDAYGPEGTREAVVRAKTALLRSVVEAGRDRGGGVDSTRLVWGASPGPDGTGNVSGFGRRVALLLGFRDTGVRSLVAPLERAGLRLVPHQRVEEAWEGWGAPGTGDGDARFRPVPPGGPSSPEELREGGAEGGGSLGVDVLSDLLFARGIDPAGYRVGRVEGRHTVVFRPDGDARGWRIGDFDTQGEAEKAARRFRRRLLDLNLACEGLHVVEHVLLRPETPGTSTVAGREVGELWRTFYALRVTVVFSGWTARGRDSEFRRFAEQIVRESGPAHLAVTCRWLDPGAMEAMETRYRRWLELRSDPDSSPADRDGASEGLVTWLLQDRDASDGDGAAPNP